jgi:hypothetical protein
MNLRLGAFMVLGLLVAAGAWAHHNMSAIFDFNDRVSFTGTLKSFDWRNPHIELMVDAKEGEELVSWKVEGPPPNFFRTRDIGRANIEAAAGKTVTIEVSRARDGSRWGLLRLLTLPDGKAVSACPQNC